MIDYSSTWIVHIWLEITRIASTWATSWQWSNIVEEFVDLFLNLFVSTLELLEKFSWASILAIALES
jgi:hypothetical protein